MAHFPKVGETVTIAHEVSRAQDGAVLGLRRKSGKDVKRISAVYFDGSIRVNHSDTWEVEMGEHGWQTTGVSK